MDEVQFSVANRSLQARLQILMESGAEQLSLNPLLGDLAADHVVGNPGGYIHSIVSVQSHLGVIGSILLFGFLLERLIFLYRSRGNLILKAITPPIMAMAVFATFFTWMPLWFLIGALFALRHAPDPNCPHGLGNSK
jgi:hypothetical protein